MKRSKAHQEVRLIPAEVGDDVPPPPPGTEYVTQWVPLGEGWEIPPFFEYNGGGPFKWKMQVQVIEGVPQCVGLVCGAHDAASPITRKDLRNFPLGRLVEDAAVMASRPRDDALKGLRRWNDIEEARDVHAEASALLAKKKPNPRRPANPAERRALLEEVARIYRDAFANGKPALAVSKQLHYTPAYARRLVMEARKEGLLPLTEPRKARVDNKEAETNG